MKYRLIGLLQKLKRIFYIIHLNISRKHIYIFTMNNNSSSLENLENIRQKHFNRTINVSKIKSIEKWISDTLKIKNPE